MEKAWRFSAEPAVCHLKGNGRGWMGRRCRAAASGHPARHLGKGFPEELLTLANLYANSRNDSSYIK